MHRADDYELIDFGDAARLERFGALIIDRPHPGAFGARRDPDPWATADLHFDRDRGWDGSATPDAPWPIEVAGLTLELRPTEAGQVGLFPEHLSAIPWLCERIVERVMPPGEPAPPSVLHLFAYTGLATLALAAAGAAVTHVDSARPTVVWARRNAALSGLDDRPIRWIVDDAQAFADREGRRGRQYDGLVLDPPSYGHGPAGRPWRLVDNLDGLLQTCATLLSPGAFVLLTAHTPGVDGDRLSSLLGRVMSRSTSAFERGELALRTSDDRRLELGAFARWPGGA